MNKKNIGILFPYLKTFGGTFQFTLSVADSLIRYSDRFNITIIHYNKDMPGLLKGSQKIDFIHLSTAEIPMNKKVAFLVNQFIGKRVFDMRKAEEISAFSNNKIDMLIIPYPSIFGYRNNIPYIVSIPDVMYKYFKGLPEFPISTRIRRNIEYGSAIKHSIFTIVDSGQGAKDLNTFFSTPRNKIRIIPYLPPNYVFELKEMDKETFENILKKYDLPDRFIFYPAQFWSHKNHTRLIEALRYIRDKNNIIIPLVLSGSPQESFGKIRSLIEELDLQDQIKILGYVTNAEIVALYKKSLALVFPSLFGPTNIPPLEAMVLGTPVICSNSFDMPEQLGDAGLLFDPYDVKDIAEKVLRLWTDEDLRKELICNAKKSSDRLNYINYARKWEEAILEALEKLDK